MNKIVVASVAASIPTVAPALAEQSADPIFAALAEYSEASVAFYAPGLLDLDEDISAEIGHRWQKAVETVASTCPTTPGGLAALTGWARDQSMRRHDDASVWGTEDEDVLVATIDDATRGMARLEPWSPPAASSDCKIDALWRRREAAIRVRQAFYRDEFTPEKLSGDGRAELERRDDELYNKYWEIQDEIRDLPPSMDQAAAISIIHATLNMEVNSTVNDDDPCGEFDHLIKLLKAMRSSLSGAVRETVDRMFDNPDETMETLGVITG